MEDPRDPFGIIWEPENCLWESGYSCALVDNCCRYMPRRHTGITCCQNEPNLDYPDFDEGA